MVFVTINTANSYAFITQAATDGNIAAETALNDGSTSTTPVVEIRSVMNGYKITHALGFAVSDIDTMSVRFFDGVIMTPGDIYLYPYSSADTSVVTGNEIQVTVVDDAAYQTVVLTAGFIADLQDVGTDEISIRFASADTGGVRGRFNQIELEFSGGEAGSSFPATIMAGF